MDTVIILKNKIGLGRSMFEHLVRKCEFDFYCKFTLIH